MDQDTVKYFSTYYVAELLIHTHIQSTDFAKTTRSLSKAEVFGKLEPPGKF